MRTDDIGGQKDDTFYLIFLILSKKPKLIEVVKASADCNHTTINYTNLRRFLPLKSCFVALWQKKQTGWVETRHCFELRLCITLIF